MSRRQPMAEQVTATEQTVGQTTTEQPKAKKTRRSVSVGFRATDGASLRVSLKIGKDGTWRTWASHRPKNGKSLRGATQHHATLKEAEAAMGKLIEKAVKLGWQKRERIGFVAKPDAFDVAGLPSPAKAKK